MKSSELWSQYFVKSYPSASISPEMYLQLKGAFFSGLWAFFTRVNAIDSDDTIKVEEGAMIMENFRQSILKKEGEPKKAFDMWLTQVYPEGTTTQQKEQLLRAFFTSMEIGFYAVSVLAGPDDEDDEIGAARLRGFKDDVRRELSEIIEGMTT